MVFPLCFCKCHRSACKRQRWKHNKVSTRLPLPRRIVHQTKHRRSWTALRSLQSFSGKSFPQIGMDILCAHLSLCHIWTLRPARNSPSCIMHKRQISKPFISEWKEIQSIIKMMLFHTSFFNLRIGILSWRPEALGKPSDHTSVVTTFLRSQIRYAESIDYNKICWPFASVYLILVIASLLREPKTLANYSHCGQTGK